MFVLGTKKVREALLSNLHYFCTYFSWVRGGDKFTLRLEFFEAEKQR